MCSEPAVSFAQQFPQMNPFQGYLFQHAANLHALENHFKRQAVLSPKTEKVIPLLPAMTVPDYVDLQQRDAMIQTQFQDVIANDSSQEIQTNQDTSIITEPISETVLQVPVLDSTLLLPDPKPTIEPSQSSTPAVSKISVIIHANNSVKIYPVHDFVEHLDLPKLLQSDSNINLALFEGHIVNPEGPPPLISDSDEDEDFDFRFNILFNLFPYTTLNQPSKLWFLWMTSLSLIVISMDFSSLLPASACRTSRHTFISGRRHQQSRRNSAPIAAKKQ